MNRNYTFLWVIFIHTYQITALNQSKFTMEPNYMKYGLFDALRLAVK